MAQANSVPVFFAFPDGVLDHVCAECTALCCRGQGFAGNLKREMGFLLDEYPHLNGVVIQRQKNLVTCATPAGRCFFLREDNLCQIEVEHGRSMKPGVCLLFPFNDVYRIGDAVAVAPHFICPLRLRLPAAPGEVEGNHAKIAETIKETELLEPGYVKRFVDRTAHPPGVSDQDLLQQEIDFRDRCSSSLGRLRFTETLEEGSLDAAELRAFTRRVSELMLWSVPSGPSQRDLLDDVLLTLAPALRLEALRHPSEGVLRVLAAVELLVRHVFHVEDAHPTLQGVHSVVEEVYPAIRLLAWADESPPLKKVRLKNPKMGDPRLTSVATVFLKNLKPHGVLPAAEKAFEGVQAAGDRSALLYQLADVVDPAVKRARR